MEKTPNKAAADNKRKDTFQFFSFLQCSTPRHSKSGSKDSGISAGEQSARASKNNNKCDVVIISDDEDEGAETPPAEPQYELLCEVEFESGQALPLPIEQKIICKVEPESIQEGSYSSAITATPQSKNASYAATMNLDSSLDQANLSECEDELLPLIKLEPHCNLSGGGGDTSKVGCGVGNNYFIYICPQCGAAFETSGGWSEHIDREHQLSDQRQFNFTQRPNNEFECNKCRAVITRCTLKTLQQHRFTHLPHKAYRCKLCRFETRSLYLMISHIMLHKEREELGEATVSGATKTGSGAATTAQKNSALEHESRLFMAYVCPACGMTFDAEDTWQAHINFRHNFLEKTAENRFEDHFKCSECSVEIFSQHISDLQQHLFTHLPFKSFLKCKLCNWTISRRNFMVSHIFNLHKQHLSAAALSAVSVPKLPKTSANVKANLFDYEPDDGLTISADENSLLAAPPPQPSRTNGGATNSVDVLQTPLVEKSRSQNEYACSSCNRYFATVAECNMHNIAAHSKYKYKCKQCEEGFNIKLDMNRHQCKNKRPLQCEVCTKEYNYEKSFFKHVKRCRTYTPRERSPY